MKQFKMAYVFLVICLFILSSMLPVISSYVIVGENDTDTIQATDVEGLPKIVKNLNFDDREDQNQSVYYMGYGIYADLEFAQSFKPTLSSLTRVLLLAKRSGNPSGIRVSIKSSLYGPDLTSKELKGDSFSSLRLNWVEFNFPDIEVQPGKTYYIVWKPTGGDPSNIVYWYFGNDNPYPDGTSWLKQSGNWNVFEDELIEYPDACFITFGYGPSVDITYPEDEETISGEVNIQGTAMGYYSEIELVEVKIDNSEWISANGTSSWNVKWDSSEVDDGPHTIYARSYDGSVYSSLESVLVFVDNLHAKLNIESPSGSNGIFSTKLVNDGNEEALLVDWSIKISGKIFGFPFADEEGTIYVLDPNEKVSIITEKTIFGLAPIVIEVSAEADNAGPISKQYECLLIGPFFLGLKET